MIADNYEIDYNTQECSHCPWKHPMGISVPPGGYIDITCHFCGETYRIFSQHITMEAL